MKRINALVIERRRSGRRRPERTCTCDIVVYPHRAGSIPGCHGELKCAHGLPLYGHPDHDGRCSECDRDAWADAAYHAWKDDGATRSWDRPSHNPQGGGQWRPPPLGLPDLSDAETCQATSVSACTSRRCVRFSCARTACRASRSNRASTSVVSRVRSTPSGRASSSTDTSPHWATKAARGYR